MRRSIRNFNIPPRAYPGHLTLHYARGGGEFEPCFGRVGNLNRIYLLFDVIRLWVFSVFAGFDGFTRWTFAFVGEYLFQGVFKRSLKMSLQHISLWKACKVFDWRRNFSLRRGSSALIGGAFERLFCPERREFEQSNLQKFKCPGGCPGGGCWTFELIGA